MPTLFDPTSPEFERERVGVYQRLRDDHPAYLEPDRDTWVLSRFDDVFRAASDTEIFSSKASEAEVLLPMLNYLDAPRHRQLRSLVSRAFTPSRVRDLTTRVNEISEDLCDSFVAAGGGDLISDFSAPLAATVVGELIGIPGDRLDTFRHLTDRLLLVGQQGDTSELATVAAGIYQTFASLLDERRLSPRDDLMSALLKVQQDGDLSDDELLGFCFLLVGGGNDTTANLIANGWVMLLDHPEQLARLTADRQLLPGAIEEMLRMQPPAESHARTTTQDLELHGCAIPANSRIQLLWGAANLDEREFPDPDRFDIERHAERHLSFGHGAHFCLGAALGRLEAQAGFNSLLNRAQSFHLKTRPQRLRSPWAHAYTRVELVL